MSLLNQVGHATHPGRGFVALAAVSIGALLALPGCGDEAIRTYQAPKAEAFVEQPLFTAPLSQAPRAVEITWDVPKGWSEPPNNSPILTAVFEAEGDAGPARITVTKLSSDGGGVLANINRWRGQVGLGPVAQFQDQPMTPIQVGEDTAGLIDLIAPEGVEASLDRLMVVFIPRPDQGLTWYFKMSGPSATLDEQQEAFASFVESVRFDSLAEDTAEASDASGRGGNSGGGDNSGGESE